MVEKIVLICKNLNDKKIIIKFNSLRKEFQEINFKLISYDEDSSYDEIINILPSWIIYTDNRQDIVEGDVLIKPLRSLIKKKLERSNYVNKI